MKVSKFYQGKLEEQQKTIEFLKQKLSEKENRVDLTMESEKENAPLYREKVVECVELGEELYETTWMLNAIENTEATLFKNISKSNGINHQVFWKNLQVPGNAPLFFEMSFSM